MLNGKDRLKQMVVSFSLLMGFSLIKAMKRFTSFEMCLLDDCCWQKNVTSTRKEVLIGLLKEVKALGQPIVGVISDAQETLRQAVAELWPEAPHQLCHFHALREASRPLFAFDHTTRTQVRKSVQKKLRAFQADTQRRFPQSEKQQSQQLGVLDAYASAIQVAINSDGLAPFQYAGLSMDEALCDLQESLARLEKKEGVNQTCTNRLRRLARILHETEAQRKSFQQIRRMREWLLEIERILAGDWATNPEEVTQVAVNQHLDAWQARLEGHVQTDTEHSEEVRCLSYLLKVVTDLKPWLTHCYAHANLPRTNNAMELLIRAIKTRYRRISGWKNWNGYLSRYGRCVAYYEGWMHQSEDLEIRLRRVSPKEWRRVRHESRMSREYQVKRYRFRHQRQQYLADLEGQWEQAC